MNDQPDNVEPLPPSEVLSASSALRSLRTTVPSDAVRDMLGQQRIDMATGFVLDLLDQRIAAGDGALDAVRLVLQHYVMIVSQSVPLAHLGCAPLRPDDRLYQCFAEFVETLHRQESQIRELTAIVAELV